MAYSTINKSSAHFNTKLYTGNGSTQSITGVGFQPDFTWIKRRDGTYNHYVFDAPRTAGKYLKTNQTSAETDGSADHLTAWTSDGFNLGGTAGVNLDTATFASWNWKANGAGSANTDGDITSTVSVNTTAGFSIATYTGNNSNAQTIGHGLGVAPKMYIIKRKDSTSAWGMYHASLGANKYLQLEATNSVTTDTGIWNNTAPTSTVLSLGNAGYFNNASGGTYVCYAFAEKQGYSKFGGYTGNGNADGTFVYTGFRPAFVIQKCSSAVFAWEMRDNKRPGYNLSSGTIYPNSNEAEGTGEGIDILSNGFKCRASGGGQNGSGNTYIYMAFAEAPFVNSKGVPCNAR